MNSVIYDLQLGFRHKYSLSHALIQLPDKIREQLDSENFACGILTAQSDIVQFITSQMIKSF